MRLLARIVVFGVWLVLAVAGTYGLYLRLVTGHQLAAYNNYIPWGLWVAFYIYFIGLSAGSFILSSVVYVGRVEKLAPLAPLALFTAAITLVMALLSIAMDLGHMNRSTQVMLHANFRSMMAWMIFLYSTYFAVILIENLLALVPRMVPWRERSGLRGLMARLVTRIPEPFAERWLHRLGLIGVPLAIAFHGGVGALFATIGARMYWHQPLFPIIFLVGALASGCGGLAAIYFLVWPQRGKQFRETLLMLGRLVLALVLADSVLEWAEFSTPLWQGISHESEIFHYLLYGPYWWNFWIIHLLLGVIVPVALLSVLGKKPWAVALGGGLVAVTFLSVRLNLVVPPLTQPLMEGLAEAYHSQRSVFEYMPSLFEWLVSGGILALGAALFYLGIKLLPLLPEAGEADGAAETSPAEGAP
jgi:protein NrfD